MLKNNEIISLMNAVSILQRSRPGLAQQIRDVVNMEPHIASLPPNHRLIGSGICDGCGKAVEELMANTQGICVCFPSCRTSEPLVPKTKAMKDELKSWS